MTRPLFRRVLTGLVASRLVVLGRPRLEVPERAPGQHDAPVLALTGR